MHLNRLAKTMLIFLVIIGQLSLISAYDDIEGIELNDVVDVAFVRYRACTFEVEYTSESPFRIEVNPLYFNENLTDELLGMKLGEIKPYLSWRESGELVEYYNTTIVNIFYDSSEETTPTTKPANFFNVFVSLAVIIVIARLKKK